MSANKHHTYTNLSDAVLNILYNVKHIMEDLLKSFYIILA
jgi:hypothetical protein